MDGDAARLLALFETEAEDRDGAWRDRLNAAFWPTRLGTFSPHYLTNDHTGLHAFRLGGNEADGGQVATEPAAIVDYALRKGIGMILWPSDSPRPLWEFGLGAVLSYRLYGTAFAPRFWNEPPDSNEPETTAEPEQILVGSPNDSMFPPLVRDAVRRVMREALGICEPKAMLLQRPNRGSRLVFDLDPGTLGGDAATARAFAMVAWCIPSCIPVYRVDAMVGSDAMKPF